MRRHVSLALLFGVLAAAPVVTQSAFAQSAPPDLDPKLTGKPVSGAQVKGTSDNPKPRDPPRGPAVPDPSTITPPAAPVASPSR